MTKEIKEDVPSIEKSMLDLSSLNEDEMEVVSLRLDSLYHMDEIASRMNISLATVYRIYASARKKIYDSN